MKFLADYVKIMLKQLQFYISTSIQCAHTFVTGEKFAQHKTFLHTDY